MERQSPRSSKQNLDGRMRRLNLAADAPDETPESVKFRALPQSMQRRLLLDYPRILATAMHQYSEGADCEDILLQVFDGTSEMLRVRNSDGDNPVASALVRAQGERAEKLVDIAARRIPDALDDRSQSRETLLMLSTSSGSSADTLMERLLMREPTQLHRLYDTDGRNFLHHCALEESIEILGAGLRITKKLIEEGKLAAGQVSAAIHMNDREGDTVLHMMAARDRHDMLSLLVQFVRDTGIGINLDVRQHRGNRWTPLMSAVSAGAFQAARFLLYSGADPLEEDTEGATVEDLAAGRPQFAELFRLGSAGAEAAVGAAPEAAVAEAGFWMTKGRSVGTVDSGTGTAGDQQQSTAAVVPDVREEPALSGLSDAEMRDLILGLAECGKEVEFVEAFAHSHAAPVTLARMSEKPVKSLMISLAYEPGFKCIIQQTLRSIGAEHLVDRL